MRFVIEELLEEAEGVAGILYFRSGAVVQVINLFL